MNQGSTCWLLLAPCLAANIQGMPRNKERNMYVYEVGRHVFIVHYEKMERQVPRFLVDAYCIL